MSQTFSTLTTAFARAGQAGAMPAVPAGVDASDALMRHFRENYPILLDGALPKSEDQSHFIQTARASLRRGKVDPDLLPSCVLRETLASLAAALPPSETKAGLTAVGPKNARIWWDETVVDNLDDVIAQLEKPRAVLRFYDITGLSVDSGRWNSTFDIDIKLEERGKSLSFWADDRVYMVDLGYVYADGRFLRLARTNTIALPRGGKGRDSRGERVKVLLRHRGVKVDAFQEPDAEARAWAEARAGEDSEQRDLRAEMLVHMLYRSFLREGPRALRRAPEITRRDPVVLQREFAQRESERRRRKIPAKPEAPALPVLLVARLDQAPAEPLPAEIRYHLVPAAHCEAAAGTVTPLSRGEFTWHTGLLAAARMDGAKAAAPVVEARAAEALAAEALAAEADADDTLIPASLVRMVPEALHNETVMPLNLLSSPVFAAAQTLRDSLAGMSALDTPEADDAGEDDLAAGGDYAFRKDILDDSMFGGSEAKRLAKAGVQITRMALTLEGRMRPGARLKVAGKLVYADASGRFRLECVLSGKRASIPMRAGTSIGGEARSLINVEWEKREGKKAVKA